MKIMSLGDRMKKNYENRSRIKLNRRTPVIMRLDGKTFHTVTKNYTKPFSIKLREIMVHVAMELLKSIQGSKCAYVQSDEISILITDFDKLKTEAWFDNNVQKMTSISAGIASVVFSEIHGSMAVFDSRVFNLPKEEVCNYFIWRQQDWTKNSLQMLARKFYSHKELQGKNSSDIHEMLYEKGVNWNKLSKGWKTGSFILEGISFNNIIFSKNRTIINNLLIPSET